MGSLIATLVIGGIAGWLAGKIMRGGGFGVCMEQNRRHHLVDLRPEPLPGRRIVAQTGRDPQEGTDE